MLGGVPDDAVLPDQNRVAISKLLAGALHLGWNYVARTPSLRTRGMAVAKASLSTDMDAQRHESPGGRRRRCCLRLGDAPDRDPTRLRRHRTGAATSQTTLSRAPGAVARRFDAQAQNPRAGPDTAAAFLVQSNTRRLEC